MFYLLEEGEGDSPPESLGESGSGNRKSEEKRAVRRLEQRLCTRVESSEADAGLPLEQTEPSKGA